MDALRKSGDSVGARVDRGRRRRAAGLGRAGLRQARRRPRRGDDVDQRGQGRGDRRRLRQRRAEGQRAPRRDDARRISVSNHAGGILGGISSGQQVIVLGGVQADLQPAPAGRHGGRRTATWSRSSPPAATTPASASARPPICEAMLALVLMDQALRHRAQCGDVGDVSPRIPGAPRLAPTRNDSGAPPATPPTGSSAPQRTTRHR